MKTFSFYSKLIPSVHHKPEFDFKEVITTWFDQNRRIESHKLEEIDIKNSKVIKATSIQKNEFDQEWQTDIHIIEDSSRDHLDFVIEMNVKPNEVRIGPLHYNIKIPKIIAEISKSFNFLVGKTLARDTPGHVKDVESFKAFIEELYNNERSLPLLVVSENAVGGYSIPELDRRLNEKLIGFVNIVNLRSDFTYQLTDRIGKDLACFDGGIRIYWPNFRDADSYRKHLLITRRFVEHSRGWNERYPESPVIQILTKELVSAASSSFRIPDRVLRKIIEAKQKLSEEVIAPTQELMASLQAERNLFEELLKNADLEIAKWKKKYESSNDQFDGLLNQLDEIRSGAQETIDPWQFTSMDAVVKLANKMFSDVLQIAEDADIDISERDLPGYWYMALKGIAEVLRTEKLGDASDRHISFKQALQENCGNSGDYKRGDTGFSYASKPIRDRIHLHSGKPGDTQSVYWQELEGHKVLIVRLGRHA